MKLVLLHSPLVGPETWRLLTPLLRSRGHDVSVADLSPVMAVNGPYYPELVRSARAVIDDPRNTVVIAHSGAGVLIPAVVEQGGAAGAIFVDALLPHPGESWFETAPDSLRSGLEKLARDGRVPPWHRWWPGGTIESLFKNSNAFDKFASELNDLPLSYFSEIAPASVLAHDFSGAYLQLSAGYAAEAGIATRNGWPVRRLARHHLAMLTDRDEVANAIDELLQAIDAGKGQ